MESYTYDSTTGNLASKGADVYTYSTAHKHAVTRAEMPNLKDNVNWKTKALWFTGIILCTALVILLLRMEGNSLIAPLVRSTAIQNDIVFTPTAPVESDLAILIYLSVKDAEMISVWQTNLHGGTNILYSSPIRYPIEVLPALELALLSDCPETPGKGCELPEAQAGYGIDHLSVSSNKHFLAWLDGIYYCPGTKCSGSGRIMLWDIRKMESRTLLEYPYHIESSADQGVSFLSWSPNSQYLGYVQNSQVFGWSRVRVIDIETGLIADVGEDAKKFKFDWAPDSKQIAYIAVDDQGEHTLRIISLGGETSITLDNRWSDIADLDWSPDGKQIAVIARSKEKGWGVYIIDIHTSEILDLRDAPPGFEFTTVKWSPTISMVALAAQNTQDIEANDNIEKGVYLLNIENGEMIRAIDNLNWLDNPHWSPDGQVIGVNSYPPGEIFSDGIAIIDATEGKTLDKLAIDGATGDWFWDSSEIIGLRFINVNQPCSLANPRGIGLYHWQINKTETIPFHQQILDQLRNCQLHIIEIAK